MKINIIQKTYQNKTNNYCALKDIDLAFLDCGLVAIIGPSGSGKTSLMNIIAGYDQDFKGQVTSPIDSECITQETQLFEDMSVYDNLLIVKDDEKMLLKLLVYFDLLEFRKVKVKKLSEGQKRRVQIIRSLLLNPMLLLCDEPDSFLDTEMVYKLMNLLKQYARQRLVIVISHDEQMLAQYADRMIKIDSGTIVKDEIINKTPKLLPYQKSIKTAVSNFRLALMLFKSKLIANIALMSVLIVAILLAGFLFNRFNQVKLESSEKIAFGNLYNYIVTDPKEKVKASDYQYFTYSPYVAFYHDTYRVLELENLLKANLDIIAVEYGFNVDYYANVARRYYDNTSPSLLESNPMAFKMIESGYYNTILRPPYLLMQEGEGGVAAVYDHPSVVSENNLVVLNLVNDYRPKLLCGEYSSAEKTAVISKNVADKHLAYYRLEEYEELLGRKISFGLDTTAMNTREKQAAVEYVDLISLNITGISDIDSEAKDFVFLTTPIEENPFLKPYVNDYADLVFGYVNFFVNPESDYAQVNAMINQKLPSEYSSFILYTSSKNYAGKLPYASMRSLFIYLGGILLLLTMIHPLYLWFTKRLRTQAKRLIKRYNYSYFKVVLTKNILSFGIVLLTCCLRLPLFKISPLLLAVLMGGYFILSLFLELCL